MSKRVAEGQGGAERYGGTDPTDSGMDPPRKATAAQLAKRSIKPLNRRPGASSRSASPSKASPGPSFNPFSAPLAPESNNNNNNDNKNQTSTNQSFTFGQFSTSSAPFGQSSTSATPFASLSSSQSFPPSAAAPAQAPAPSTASSNKTPSFSFGQSQPAPTASTAAPSFAPPSSSSFNFAAANTAGSSFTFGASPAKPQPQPQAQAQKQNEDSSSALFSFGSQKPAHVPASFDHDDPDAKVYPITPEERDEIEAAGPRLIETNKLEDLANIVRQTGPHYKDANLAGLNLMALPAAIQRKMLDFVRQSLLTVVFADPDEYYRTHTPSMFPFVTVSTSTTTGKELLSVNKNEILRVRSKKGILPEAWVNKAYMVDSYEDRAIFEDFKDARGDKIEETGIPLPPVTMQELPSTNSIKFMQPTDSKRFMQPNHSNYQEPPSKNFPKDTTDMSPKPITTKFQHGNNKKFLQPKPESYLQPPKPSKNSQPSKPSKKFPQATIEASPRQITTKLQVGNSRKFLQPKPDAYQPVTTKRIITQAVTKQKVVPPNAQNTIRIADRMVIEKSPQTPVSAHVANAHRMTLDDLDSPMSEEDGSLFVLPTWKDSDPRPNFGVSFSLVAHPNPTFVARVHSWIQELRSAPKTAPWNLGTHPPFSTVSAYYQSVNLIGNGQAPNDDCDMIEVAQPAEDYVTPDYQFQENGNASAYEDHTMTNDSFFYQTEPAKTPFSFGKTAATPSAFGTSTAATPSAFGTSPAAPSSSFGTSNVAPSAFGTSTAAPTSTFGASNNTTNNNNNGATAQSSPFNGFGSTAPTQPSAAPAAPSFGFGNAKAESQKNETTAAPAASPFNFGKSTEPSKPSAPVSAQSFSFGASNAASPAPAASSPTKTGSTSAPSFSFGTSTSAQKPADQVSYPKLNQTETSSESTSSFNFTSSNKISESAPSTAFAESPKPQSKGFGSSMFSSAPSQGKPAESSFTDFGASSSSPSASTPSSSFSFGGAAAQPAAAQSQSKASSSQEPSSQASSSSALSSQQNGFSALTKSFSAPRAITPPDTPDTLKPVEHNMLKMRQLNEKFRAQIASADSTHDWSDMVQFYLDRVEQLSEQTNAAPSTKAIQTAPFSSSSTLGQKRKADEEASKPDDDKRSKTIAPSTTPQKPLSDTASLFNDILNSSEKPKTPQPTNVFSSGAKTPATAPPAKSNPFAAIARNVSATPGPGPKSAAPSSTGFAPPAASSTKPAASPFQVKPANPAPSTAPTAPTFQLPKFSVGAGAGATPNFLSAFGKKAAAEEEKEREMRKAEDMDSDEDEEEWEKRDAEEQAKKKAQLQSAGQSLKFTLDSSKTDAPPSSVFSFGKTSSAPTTSAPAASSSNIFGHLSGTPAQDEQESDADDDEDVHVALNKASTAKPTAGKSLFDRIELLSDSEKDKTSAPGTPSKFSSFGSNTSPAGDNTWKENTPIKFGGMSTATSGTTTPDGSPVKPAGASMFSSQSAAATPKFDFAAASKTIPASDKPATPFSGMFGSKKDETPKPSTPATSIFATEASKSSPSVGFQFGGPGSNSLAPPSAISSLFPSATTSRATTPGATTTDAEGSAAESEPSDTPNEAQKDLSALSSAEIADNDLLQEGKCRVMKFFKSEEPQWQTQGTGPVRLLRSKATGKPRVLMRTNPGGKIVLNFNLLLNKGMYTVVQVKQVQMMVATADKKLETLLCTFGNAEKAEAFKSALHEAIDKTEK